MFNFVFIQFFIKINEWYKWIFLALSTMAMITYFSPEIGLGEQKTFSLYNLFVYIGHRYLLGCYTLIFFLVFK